MLVSCCPRLVNNSNVLHLFFISFVTLCVHIVHLNEWYFLSFVWNAKCDKIQAKMSPLDVELKCEYANAYAQTFV